MGERAELRPATRVWVDSGRVETSGITQEHGSRRGLQAIGGNPRFGEDMTFDIGGQGFRIARWCLGLAAVIQVIRSQALQRHVRSPGVVPVFEFDAQGHQMIRPLDERDAFEPFVFRRLDDPPGDRNGPALSDRAEAGFDVPLIQQLGKSTSGKDMRLVRDDVFRRSGLCRIFRTVEAERKMPSSLSWLAMRIRPEPRLALVISQTREAISVGVLLAGAPEGFWSSPGVASDRGWIRRSRSIGRPFAWESERFPSARE